MREDEPEAGRKWGPRVPLYPYVASHVAIAAGIVVLLLLRGSAATSRGVVPAGEGFASALAFWSLTTWWWVSTAVALCGAAAHVFVGVHSRVAYLRADVQPAPLRDAEASLHELFESSTVRDAFPPPPNMLARTLAAAITRMQWLTASSWAPLFGAWWVLAGLALCGGVVAAKFAGYELAWLSANLPWLAGLLGLALAARIAALCAAMQRPQVDVKRLEEPRSVADAGQVYDAVKHELLEVCGVKHFASGVIVDRPQTQDQISAIEVVLLTEGPPHAVGCGGTGTSAALILDGAAAALGLVAWSFLILLPSPITASSLTSSVLAWALGWMVAVDLLRAALLAHLTFRFRSVVSQLRIAGAIGQSFSARQRQLRLSVRTAGLVSEAAWERSTAVGLRGLLVADIDAAFRAPRFGVGTWRGEVVQQQFEQVLRSLREDAEEPYDGSWRSLPVAEEMPRLEDGNSSADDWSFDQP